MKTLKIENAKTKFFNTKEDYLAFRESWKKFHREGNAKPQFVEEKRTKLWYDTTVHKTKRDEYMEKVKKTPLSAEHYILYNILRGKDIATGFTPIKNKAKLNAHRYWPGLVSTSTKPNQWYALNQGIANLLSDLSYATLDTEGKPEWQKHTKERALEKLLLPFGDLPLDKFPEIIEFLRTCLGEIRETELAELA